MTTLDAHKRRALVLGLVALGLRAAYVLAAGQDVRIKAGTDALHYDAFARLMMSGWDWFSTPLAVREPLYPLLMVLAYALPGSEIGALQFLQTLLGAATAVGVYLGLRSLTRETVALLAGFLVALNPHFIFYAALPYRENLIIPLLAGFVLVTVHAAPDFRISRPFVSSLFLILLFLILLVHTDSRFLPFIFVFPAMVLILNRSWKTTLRIWAWSLLFFVLLMIPYQVRGFVAFGKPVIVTERVLGKWLPLFANRLSSDGQTAAAGTTKSAWFREWEAEKREQLDRLSPQERAYFEAGGGDLLWVVWRSTGSNSWSTGASRASSLLTGLIPAECSPTPGRLGISARARPLWFLSWSSCPSLGVDRRRRRRGSYS